VCMCLCLRERKRQRERERETECLYVPFGSKRERQTERDVDSRLINQQKGGQQYHTRADKQTEIEI
jgi:hypothetical protein